MECHPHSIRTNICDCCQNARSILSRQVSYFADMSSSFTNKLHKFPFLVALSVRTQRYHVFTTYQLISTKNYRLCTCLATLMLVVKAFNINGDYRLLGYFFIQYTQVG